MVIKIANAIRNQCYSNASMVFAAGSLIRGDGTAFSDLDLVVVYESLPLPRGVQLAEQQFHVLMHEQGVVEVAERELVEYATELRKAIVDAT